MRVRSSLGTQAAAATLFAALAVGCGGPGAEAPTAASAVTRSIAHPGKPALALITREGDPLGAFAAAVTTTQIESGARDGDVAVALAALMEERLATRGLQDFAATPSIDGYRLRARAKTPDDATRGLAVISEALAAPVAEAEMAAVAKKLAALDRRLLTSPALADVSACRGEPFAVDLRPAPIDRDTLERWRHAAHGLGRVALAAVGTAALTRAADASLASSHAWSDAAPLRPATWRADGDAHLYILPSETTVNHAVYGRVELAIRTRDSARAVAIAEHVGSSHGALAARLSALESPARLVSVSATAHPSGGCVAVRVELSDQDTRDTNVDASRPRDEEIATRLASALSVAAQEASVEAEDATSVASGDVEGLTIARRAGDAREAAESAAWWALADTAVDAKRTNAGGPSSTANVASAASVVSVAVGVAAGRDGGIALDVRDARETQLLGRVRAEIDRTSRVGAAPVAELRSRVEHGQGETWVLVASPCGAIDEGTRDAGLAAAVSLAAVGAANADDGVTIEPWATIDGTGVLAHGAPHPGETPVAAARRIASAAARGFAATPLDSASLARARSELLSVAASPDARALATVAEALAPGHPAWFEPLGTAASVGSASDAAILTRAAALRAGPIRVAILAGDDEAQITNAAQAVDRWMVRRDTRPGTERACASAVAASSAIASKPGTYVVDATNGTSEAWLALPLAPSTSAAASTQAALLASVFDGEGGLLRTTLEGAGLVRSASAHVVGPAARSSLIFRLAAPASALDAAVAETRALVDRVRAGALDAAMFARAVSRESARLNDELATPRGRVADIWTNGTAAKPSSEATLASLRAYAAATLREDAWVIVVARPPSPRPAHPAAATASATNATAGAGASAPPKPKATGSPPPSPQQPQHVAH